MSEPEEITTMSGQKLPLKMSVDYISFSAHTDYQQTSEFIRALKPPHVVSLKIPCVVIELHEAHGAPTDPLSVFLCEQSILLAPGLTFTVPFELGPLHLGSLISHRLLQTSLPVLVFSSFSATSPRTRMPGLSMTTDLHP